MQVKHYSIRTEQAYVDWIKRYILFHNKRHPAEMGSAEIEAFLTYLAVEQHVAASSQNQAFSALLFLYLQVLGKDLDFPIDPVRATCTATVVKDPNAWLAGSAAASCWAAHRVRLQRGHHHGRRTHIQ